MVIPPLSKNIPGIYLIMRERTYMYKALSELLKDRPHEQIIESIFTERFRKLGDTVDDEFELIKSGHGQICAFIDEHDGPEEIEASLRKEHEKILQGARYALQRNYEAMGEDEVLNSLSDFYEKENWLPPEGHPEQLDHLSVQSEFMVYLCAENRKAIINRTADVVHQTLEVQRDFLDRHVYNWFPSFADELEKRAISSFYTGLAKLTKGFIAMDKEAFTEIIKMVS